MLFIEGEEMELAQVFEYDPDSHLNFEHHINQIYKLSALGKTRVHVDQSTAASMLYKSLVLAVVDYCDTAFMTVCEKYIVT